VDSIYVAIQLVFVLVGAFWLAQYVQSVHRDACWGLAFLLIPAVAVSLDRVTIDLALAALTRGPVILFDGSIKSSPTSQIAPRSNS
jgi:hypothetical protein